MNLEKIKELITMEFGEANFEFEYDEDMEYITFDFEELMLEHAKHVKVIMSAFTNSTMLIDIYIPGIDVNLETYKRVNDYNLALPFKATIQIEEDVTLLNLNTILMNLSSEEELVGTFTETLHVMLMDEDYFYILFPLLEMIKLAH